MAFFFADTWDLYAAPADVVSYWDSGGSFTLAAGRFAGSRGASNSGGLTVWGVKSSGQNDAVHHFSIAFQQTTALTGTNAATYLQLSDGATNQCCVVFRSDGAILLTSATPTGTALATYTGAVTAANTWYQFEFEVVINNTAGRFRVRKNGNVSDDFDSGATLNTRPGANSYANKLTVGVSTSTGQVADDLVWRSDVSSVPWLGDLRGWARMPVSDASVQWTPSGSAVPVTPFATASSSTPATTAARFTPFTVPCDGSIGTIVLSLNAANTGNVKCSLFASSGSAPTAVLGSATPLNNLPGGNNTFTFSSPVTVTRGTQYWVGFITDTAAASSWNIASSATSGVLQSGTTYAAFPTANPTTSSGQAIICTVNVAPTTAANAPFVTEPQQDAANSYVYSSTVGNSDLYGIAPISSTPASVVAVVTRAYVQKSDAGTRNVAVQLRSGGTTVQGTSTALNTTFGWISRVDTVDPATGLPWTAVGVANCNIGVVVTA